MQFDFQPTDECKMGSFGMEDASTDSTGHREAR